MLKQAKITISGQVQGVFYRVWAKRQASELNLTGIARNEPGETVLIVAEGQEDALKEFIERCRQGPELAKVSDLQVEWSDHKGKFEDFSIE